MLFLTGCVAVSTNLEQHEDFITGQIYYSLELGVSYPAKKFMTPEEWEGLVRQLNQLKNADTSDVDLATSR